MCMHHHCDHIFYEVSEYSRVLTLPTRGVLLCVFWMAMILMMYSVDGLRSEERNNYYRNSRNIYLKQKWHSVRTS